MGVSKYTTVKHYEASIVANKIVLNTITNEYILKEKETRFKDRVNLTKEDAKNKILEVLEDAEKRANKIRKLIKDLEKSEDFYIDYTMDGDTYGIYEDHLDINFKYKGFYFNFTMGEF